MLVNCAALTVTLVNPAPLPVKAIVKEALLVNTASVLAAPEEPPATTIKSGLPSPLTSAAQTGEQ